jgi:hypothetical protein
MEPRVVMVNLVQCWRCKQYIPPGEQIRARVMRTAVEYGSGLNSGQVNRFEPVSLCVRCDEAVALEDKAAQDRSARHMRWVGWVCGAFFMTVVFRAIDAPWPIAVLGAGGLAWLGILGRSIIALFMVINTLELTLGKKMVDAHDAGIILGVIMVLVIGKFSWKIAQRSRQQLSRSE